MLDSVEVIGVLSLWLSLLLGVDRCDIGGWLGVRRHQAGLFAMADKVLQVLYRAHGGGGESDLGLECEGRKGRGNKRAKSRNARLEMMYS